MNTIKNGSKGDDVKTLQLILNYWKNYDLTPDGNFGPKTETAVKDFQKVNNLSVDGIVGPKSWAVLEQIISSNTIRNGNKGDNVKVLQHILSLTVDGIFGPKTETAVKEFQIKNGLTIDGIVGPKTWKALMNNSNSSNIITDLEIDNSNMLKPGEYVDQNTTKDLIVLHHTAGWNNPYQVINSWNTDTRGRVTTEFVIGGIRCNNGDTTYDGKIVRAYPEGKWGYHIGTPVGASGMDKRSTGIEVCDFGHVKDGKTYSGAIVQPEQIVTLNKKFRGYQQFHRYSDKSLESLRKILLYIADRDNIDLHTGIYQWIKKQGADAFDFQSDAYYGKVKKGMVTHANIRKDKEDMFPQPELIDMILSL